MKGLSDFGYGPFFSRQWDPTGDPGRFPARVAAEHRGGLLLFSERGELPGRLSGRLRDQAARGGLRPATGDWVLARLHPGGVATVERVLARRSSFARKEAGARSAPQVVAANVDVVFVVQALGGDLNPRRLERYLALVWEGGADPVVLLNKADLAEDARARAAEIAAIAAPAAVIATSARTGDGLDAVRARLGRGRTGAFVGSSGVGKSSLVNRLLGAQAQAVAEVRADGRGRHTTSARRLLSIPGGGLLLDTPGMREIGLWGDAEEGLAAAFEDIAALAAGCRFRDCRHENEPGCAVLAAIAAGRLDPARAASQRALVREATHEARRQDRGLQIAEKRAARRAERAIRRFYRDR